MKNALASLFLLSVFTLAASADTPLKLPTVISDHMVLQADKKDPIWGWAPAGAKVTVDFLDASGKSLAQADATAGADGKWTTLLGPLTSGAAGQLKVTAGTDVKTVADVLVGESWLCGGQSNMTYTVRSDNVPRSVIRMAKQQATDAKGAIRYIYVDGKSSDTPQDDVGGRWQIADAQSVNGCSAVGWYFAVALHDKLHVPIGLVISAVGGTRVEQWTSKEALNSFPEGVALEKRYDDIVVDIANQKTKYDTDNAAWLQANNTPDLQAKNQATKPRPPGGINLPSQLYNGMIHGLVPFAFKGILWFQADGNMDRPDEYGPLIKGMITQWRKDWNEELPFYYVEMNNMREDTQQKPIQPNALSRLRETQDAALELPKTGVVSCIELGNAQEPHFPNKQPVGIRLAGLALNNLYNQPGLVESPTYKSFTVEGGKIRLKLNNADGLRVRGYAFQGFAISGADGRWVWADGEIDGQDVVVWSEEVPNPTAVRYAWAMNPLTSIENGSGLPLRPFRTDKDSAQ
jgi:sialate O-acetylesterase